MLFSWIMGECDIRGQSEYNISVYGENMVCKH